VSLTVGWRPLARVAVQSEQTGQMSIACLLGAMLGYVGLSAVYRSLNHGKTTKIGRHAIG